MADDEEEPEYQVEGIRQWRYNLREKRKEYLIKWHNYPEEENTWEPEDHLNCPDTLDEFISSLVGDDKRLFHSKNLIKLNGIQRNAYFNIDSIVGAEEVSQYDAGDSQRRKKLYFIVKFDDNDVPELIDAASIYQRNPVDMMELVESRLLAKMPDSKGTHKRKHRKRIISISSDED